MAVRWETVSIPFGAGIDNRADPRALQPPGLTSLKNGQFTELGGLQKRLPLTAVSGGSLAIRRLAIVNDELLAFTATEVYSWSAAVSGWVSRGTYLAPKVTERSVFVRTTEQSLCDRAELSNVIVYVWRDGTTTTTAYVAAMDKTTGAVLLAPTSLGANTDYPRLIPLTSRILLFAKTGTNALGVKALNVSSAANLSTTAAAAFTDVDGAAFDEYYDVAKLSSTTAAVVWTRTTTTAYGYASVNETPTVTASTKARNSTGAIGVAVTADGASIAVIRLNSTDVLGDILTSGFVDSSTGAAVGASASTDALSCAFRSVADSGQFRCQVYWSNDEVTTASSAYVTRFNYVDTAGNVGTEADFAVRLSPASKAFDHNGSTYLWLVFNGSASGTAAQVQSTYFLYRDDKLLVAKSAPYYAGGFPTAGGQLPTVQSLGSNRYVFCGVERRIVPVASGIWDYADRGPRDITVEFDSNEARRSVQLGKTLYITGGQIVQYDGEGVVEVGFHVLPHYLSATSGGAGNLAVGTYGFLSSRRWDNAQGEMERSSTGAIISASITASKEADISSGHTPATLKTSSRSGAAHEIWRTPANPSTDTPYYLVTSKDPTATGDNGYLTNNPTSGNFSTFSDNFADATLITKETWPEAGGILESLAPPPATIIAANQDRIFLAGVSYDPYLVCYSRLRADGEVASFHDALTIQVPPTGGIITGLAFVNETLVVFCEHAIWALPGDGFDNLGGGQNYGPARLIATDVGATSADVIATVPDGVIFFSSKGWYLLDRGFNAKYIGAPVCDFDTDTFLAVTVLEAQHQIRCLSSSRILTYDYVANQWSEWEEASRVSALVWSGSYYAASSSALLKEATSHGTDVTYSLIPTTAWIKVADLQGFKRVRHVMILGEYRSAHRLKVELFRDYDDSAAFQTVTWTVSPTTVGGPLQIRIGPAIQKMEAIKIRITDIATGSSSPPTGEALKLTGLALEIGVKPGLHRLPAAQKA